MVRVAITFVFALMLSVTSVIGSAAAKNWNTGSSNQNSNKSALIQTVEITTSDGLSGYFDIFEGNALPKKTITATLYLPSECDDKKFPAVIIQHGSGSPEKPWYSKLAMELNKRGIVAIVPNSFKARGISSTGSNQSKLSKATRLVDAFSTFKYLRTLNCVDPNRIGLTGYSFGGIIALDSAEKKIASKLGGGFEYKAVLPVYPSCQATFENPKSTKTKIHVLAGELDDFTPAKYCIDSVENKKMLGWDIEITVLKGAHHGFNLESAPSVIKNSWVFAECGTISISDDGYEKSNKYNVTTKNGWGQYVKTLVAKCGKKGPTIGGSPDLAKKTLEFTVKFFQHNL